MADGIGGEQAPIVRASDEHAAQARLPATVGMTPRSDKRRLSSPHAHKFRAATATLVGVAIGAVVIALAVLVSGSGGAAQSAAWSSWSPPDGGVQGAREIADHLAPFYRISPVDQLDVVTVANLSNRSTAASGTSASTAGSGGGLQVAVRADPASSAVSMIGGNTIAYNLCGIGTANCAIGVGTPTADRLLLLRREALELALYTFRYLNGTENVVAILPPGHTVQASTLTPTPPSAGAKTPAKPVDIALLFLRDELKPWLTQPLSETFPEQFPPTVPELASWKQTTEAALVEQVTARGLFSEHLVQAQDGSSLIVLDPLPPS
jgi:hypothetical protein